MLNYIINIHTVKICLHQRPVQDFFFIRAGGRGQKYFDLGQNHARKLFCPWSMIDKRGQGEGAETNHYKFHQSIFRGDICTLWFQLSGAYVPYAPRLDTPLESLLSYCIYFKIVFQILTKGKIWTTFLNKFHARLYVKW